MLLTFEDALEDSKGYPKRHVLLGNGFSIACRPNIFLYERLFEQADFSRLSRSAREAFDALDTQAFEKVIRALRDADKLVRLYEMRSSHTAERMRADADALREVLVTTIAQSHPEWPGEITDAEYANCRAFLDNFDTIYTVNYDLLLYWAQMHNEEGQEPKSDDGFRTPYDDLDSEYVTWEAHQSHGQNTWFLHGALHVFDAGAEVRKFTWVNTGIRLIDQIRNALEQDYYPLFVAEGTSEEKLTKIRHSDYLGKAYRSFSSIGGALFTFGHSLAANDEHFLQRIERGSVQHLYVGIYRDPEGEANKDIIDRASQMPAHRRGRQKPLKVSFYDASTATVWK